MKALVRQHSVLFEGRCWRLKTLSEAAALLHPAHSPEGRFHSCGQSALYLSLSPEGCEIATRAYRTEHSAPAGIFPLGIKCARIVDLADGRAVTALGIDISEREVDWQSQRRQGLPATTWSISDRVRQLGLDGMVYPSRSKPELSHLTLFRWNTPGCAQITQSGPPLPLSADGSSAASRL